MVNWRRRLVAQVRGRVRDDSGQVTVFVVVSLVTMVLFAGLALDGGLALAAKIRALGQAQEAARAGAQAVDVAAYRNDGTWRLTPRQARTLARQHLRDTGHQGTVRATEQTVTVTVTTHQPTKLLQLAGLETLTVTGDGAAQPRRGISSPEP